MSIDDEPGDPGEEALLDYIDSVKAKSMIREKAWNKAINAASRAGTREEKRRLQSDARQKFAFLRQELNTNRLTTAAEMSVLAGVHGDSATLQSPHQR
jgi:hypothetical protein